MFERWNSYQVLPQMLPRVHFLRRFNNNSFFLSFCSLLERFGWRLLDTALCDVINRAAEINDWSRDESLKFLDD